MRSPRVRSPPSQLQSGLYRRLMRNVYADPALVADHQLFARAARSAHAGRCRARWPVGSSVVRRRLSPRPDRPRPGGGSAGHAVGAGRAAFGSTGRPSGRPRRDDASRTRVASITADATRHGVGRCALETRPRRSPPLDGMMRSGPSGRRRLSAVLAVRSGRWGSSRVAKVLPLVDGRSESPPESWVRVACVRAGLPAPVPQFDVVEGGEFLGPGGSRLARSSA